MERILVTDWLTKSDNTPHSQRGAICEYPSLRAEGGCEVELSGQLSVFAAYVNKIPLTGIEMLTSISSCDGSVCCYVSHCCDSEGGRGVME